MNCHADCARHPAAILPSRRGFIAGLACAAALPAAKLAAAPASADDERFMRVAIDEARQADFPFGAVIVRDNRVVAAGCTLPLSDRADSGFQGLRHRSALGLSERTDAVAVVVSEETGQISIAANGRMISNLDGPRLRGILRSLLLPALDLDRPSGRRLPRLSR